MIDPASRLAEAQERINAKRLVELPTANMSISCAHCGGEVSWDDGYVCTPCDLSFDLDSESSHRYQDHEPECAVTPGDDDAMFWTKGGFKLHPCNLTAGHETAEHHHPMTLEPKHPAEQELADDFERNPHA